MPTGATITYRAANANKFVATNWATKKIDCTPLNPGFCEMAIVLEPNVWAKVEIYGVGWFNNGDKVWMPSGAMITYRAQDVKGATTCWKTKPVDCTALVPGCATTVTMPNGTWVEISGVGWFKNGDTVNIKPIVTYSYRLWNAGKTVASGWKTKVFSASNCCNGWNLTAEFCNMGIDLGSSDGWVEISGVGWFQGTASKVWLPGGSTISYRLWNSAKTVANGWKTKTVDCTALAVGAEFCSMGIDLGSSDGWVEISGVGWFQGTASKVWLPGGSTISYRLWNSAKTVANAFKTKTVDCNPLAVGAEFCNMSISLTPNTLWVEISGVGWFQGSGSVWLPMAATIQYRIWDANKQNVLNNWTGKSVDCTDLVYPLT
jgi:uncharacterized protein YbdZ (MbtH family)